MPPGRLERFIQLKTWFFVTVVAYYWCLVTPEDRFEIILSVDLGGPNYLVKFLPENYEKTASSQLFDQFLHYRFEIKSTDKIISKRSSVATKRRY